MQVYVGPIRRRRGAFVPVRVRVEHPGELVEHVRFAADVPLVVEGTVTNTGNGYLLDGVVRAVLELECGRCLRPVRWPLEARLCERYLAEDEGGAPSGETGPGDEEDEADGTYTFRGDYLDMSEAVREQIVVSLPMKLVCRDDCQGMCPKCGKVLNDGPCDCDEEPADIRLAPLAEWLKAARQRNGEA